MSFSIVYLRIIAVFLLFLLAPTSAYSCNTQQHTTRSSSIPTQTIPSPIHTTIPDPTKSTAQTNPTVIAISGDITQSVTAFKALITTRISGDASGQLPLHQDLNWDNIRGNVYLNTNLASATFLAAKLANTINPTAPSGTFLRISDNNFSDLNSSYARQFSAFSPKQMIGLTGGSSIDISFLTFLDRVPGSVQGFGVVFSDVDRDGTTIEYFSNTTSLGKFNVPTRSDPQGLSFLGVFFEKEKGTHVRITVGQSGLSNTVQDVSAGGTLDLVVMDNMLFSDPQKLIAQNKLDDFPLPNGHFYTQARGNAPQGYGYALTDADGIKFWSEFQRLGGVEALGYPASQRFMLDGFWTQATQRVLMQWRPEVGQVYFINIFDKLHDLGRDADLQQKYQVPPQLERNKSGKSFEQITAERLAWLDANLPIKTRYFASDDPLRYNGLPTSYITDASGTFDIIRCQRVVIQYWKVSIGGISNAGDVQISLGGDIAKEFGLIPAPAIVPAPPP